MNLFKITITAFFSIIITGCFSDHVDNDIAGVSIDCEQLLSDSKELNGKYLYDYEATGGHKFSQCREEIKEEHKQRCDEFIDLAFDSNTVNYFSDYTNMKNDGEKCATEVASYVASYVDKYQFNGNALEVNGYTFNIGSLALSPISEWHVKRTVDVSYFVFKVSSGDVSTWLRFGSEEIAKNAHQEFSHKIASEG